MTVSGPTGCGKTWLVKNILQQQKIEPAPDRIVYLYKRWQPLYSEMQETIPNIEFVKSIPENLDHDSFFDVKKTNVIILDDMMSSTATDARVSDLFSEGSHHRSLGVINLTQNLFPPGRNAVTQRRNTQYMVVFKSPMSQDQIRTLGTFMFPGRLDEFLHLYNSVTKQPYGYLIIDAKQDTPEAERFKTSIMNNTFVMAPSGFPTDEALYQCGLCNFTHDQENVFDGHKCGKNVGIDTSGYRFFCPLCKNAYTTAQALAKHQCRINTQTLESSSHSMKNNSTNNMSDTHDCLKCGALYNTPRAMIEHMSRCRTEDESDTDSESDTSIEVQEDESVWESLLQEVYDEKDAEYQAALLKHADTVDAKERVLDEMRPVYKKALKDLFSIMFGFGMMIKNSKRYKAFVDDVNDFVEEKEYSLSKAIKAAVRRNENIFDDVLDDDEDGESSEDSSSETSMSEDDE